jgi:hypothetical protein
MSGIYVADYRRSGGDVQTLAGRAGVNTIEFKAKGASGGNGMNVNLDQLRLARLPRPVSPWDRG